MDRTQIISDLEGRAMMITRRAERQLQESTRLYSQAEELERQSNANTHQVGRLNEAIKTLRALDDEAV